VRVWHRRIRPLRPPAPRRIRRSRPLWPLLALLVPIAAIAAWRLVDDGGPSAAAEREPADGAIAFDAPIGDRITGPRCLMVVVDESSSMTEADATGARADAVQAAADFLQAYGLPEDRIGTTWFADDADVVGPDPASTATAARAAESTALGSGTKIASALRSALAAMATGCGRAQPVLVLVSDGQASGPAQFELARDVIAGADGLDLHMIALDGNQAFDSVRSFWADPALGLDSIETISSFGRDEVAAAMAAILTLETGQRVEAGGPPGTAS
jgi:von Willebrand factor type A domain